MQSYITQLPRTKRAGKKFVIHGDLQMLNQATKNGNAVYLEVKLFCALCQLPGAIKKYHKTIQRTVFMLNIE